MNLASAYPIWYSRIYREFNQEIHSDIIRVSASIHDHLSIENQENKDGMAINEMPIESYTEKLDSDLKKIARVNGGEGLLDE
jgi:hypothetical protein